MGSQQFQILLLWRRTDLIQRKTLIGETGLYDGSVLRGSAGCCDSTIYNEYHVVLESGMKETDMNVFNIEDAGVAMLEDTLIAKEGLRSDRTMIWQLKP